MSCLHRRPKRTNSEEQAFQEHMKKVAQENGKRLGESAPKGSTGMREAKREARALLPVLPTQTGLCARTLYFDNLDLGPDFEC